MSATSGHVFYMPETMMVMNFFTSIRLVLAGRDRAACTGFRGTLGCMAPISECIYNLGGYLDLVEETSMLSSSSCFPCGARLAKDG